MPYMPETATTPPGPQWQRVEIALMNTARQLRRTFDGGFAGLGLNLSQATALAMLVEEGSTTQSDLARRLDMGRAAAGSLIDHLESSGFVRRSPDPADRRVWLIEPTPEGTRASAEITAIDERLRSQLRNGISRRERQELASVLNRMRSNIDTLDAP